MDSGYQNALAYRDVVASKINTLKDDMLRLQAEANRVERFIKEWEDFASGSERSVNNDESTTPKPADKPKRESLGNPSKDEIAQHARDIIDVLDQPVSRNLLLTELENSGVVLRGADPKMILSTTMWRLSKDGGEFVRLPKFGYWLRNRDYEPAGYRANTVPQDEVERRRREMIYDHPRSALDREETMSREDEQV